MGLSRVSGDVRAALVEELKRIRPLRVMAFLDDGQREIAVPSHRKRWDRVATILDGLPWRKVECLDKSGALLGCIEAEEASPDAEVDPAVQALAPKEHAFLKLMLHAQEVSSDRLLRALSDLIVGYQNLVGTVSERLGALEKNYASNLELAAQAVYHVRQGGEAGESDPLVNYLMAKFGPALPPTVTGAMPGNGAPK